MKFDKLQKYSVLAESIEVLYDYLIYIFFIILTLFPMLFPRKEKRGIQRTDVNNEAERQERQAWVRR